MALALLGLALFGLLVWLVPDRRVMEQQMGAQRLDKLSLVYLELALHEHPEDARLRLLLAQRYYELSRYDDAEAILTPLVDAGSPDGREARLLRVEVRHARCAMLVREGHASAQACAQLLVAEIRGWAEDGQHLLPPAMVDRLAQIGMANGAPDLATDLYTRLAQHATSDQERALWQSKAAMAAAKPDLSAELGRKLLAMNPHDPALLQRQIDAELAIGEVARALALAQRLVAIDPANRRAREQLAIVADWAGHPLLALDHWAWLARHGKDPRYLERAMALARSNWDQRLLLDLSWLAVGADGPSRQDVLDLAAQYVRLGEPETARALLARQIAAHPGHRPSWDALLDIQLAMTDLDSAARSWAQIHQRFGTSEAERRQRATLLWRAGHPLEALAVMEEDGPLAAPFQEADSLRLTAALAWRMERLEPARRAYEALWRRGQARVDEIERLMLLGHHTERPELAMEVAMDRWEREHDPVVLLAAMRMALDARRWNDLDHLMRTAEESPGALEAEPDYWRLRMALGHRRLRMALGREDLRGANQALVKLDQDLARAAVRSERFARTSDYAALRADVHRQQLHVALQRGDRDTAAQVLARAGDDIPPVDRVDALTRLGRETEATRVAVDARERARSDGERVRLTKQAEALAGRHPRHVEGHTRLLGFGGLQLFEAGGGIRFAWEQVNMGLRVAGRRLEAAAGLREGAVSEAEVVVLAQRRGKRSSSEVGAGAVVREASAHPRLSLRHWHGMGGSLRAGIEASLGEPSEEDALLRTLAMRDHVAARVAFEPAGPVFVHGRVAGVQFRSWGGGRVGTGMDIEGSVGYRLLRGPRDWNVRLIGLLTPRALESTIWPGQEAGVSRLDGASRLSLATTLSRGWPGTAPSPVAGRLRYFAELAGGWLVMTDTLGYSLALGLGLPVLGGDELWLSAMLADEPGTVTSAARHSLVIGYTRSLWR